MRLAGAYWLMGSVSERMPKGASPGRDFTRTGFFALASLMTSTALMRPWVRRSTSPAQRAARGVEYLFANGGTDFAPVVEACAKGQALGWRLPEVVIVPHENLGVAMAHGYTMITGRPQAMMVHVGVGTANAVNGLMNASRMNIPLLFSAGRTPLPESGALPGARNNYIHWAQEHFDQGGMLREFM